MLNRGPRIVVVTAPSGSGKTSIARRLLAEFPAMRFSVSATTRPSRGTERDGVEYHFLTAEQFRSHISAGDFVEFVEVYPGRFYGTLRSEIESATPDAPILLDVDVLGAERVKELFADDALVVFVRPPSLDVLEARLRARQTESSEDLRIRLERVRLELSYEDRFDVVVINDDLDRACQETIRVVRSFLSNSKAGDSHD